MAARNQINRPEVGYGTDRYFFIRMGRRCPKSDQKKQHTGDDFCAAVAGRHGRTAATAGSQCDDQLDAHGFRVSLTCIPLPFPCCPTPATTLAREYADLGIGKHRDNGKQAGKGDQAKAVQGRAAAG